MGMKLVRGESGELMRSNRPVKPTSSQESRDTKPLSSETVVENKPTPAERLAAVRAQSAEREAAGSQEREERRATYEKPIPNTVALNELDYLSEDTSSNSWVAAAMSQALDSSKFTTIETSIDPDGLITLKHIESPEAKAKAREEIESQYADWVKGALTRSDIENERLKLQTKGTVKLFGRFYKLGEVFPEGSERYNQLISEAERKANEDATASAKVTFDNLRYAGHVVDASVSEKQLADRKRELSNIGAGVNKQELEGVIEDLRRAKINLQGRTVVDLSVVKLQRSELARQLLDLRRTLKEARGSQKDKVELANKAIVEAEAALQAAEEALAAKEREKDTKVAKEREKLAKAETAALEARQSYDSFTNSNPLESVKPEDLQGVRKETMRLLTTTASKDRKVGNINSTIDLITSTYETGSEDSKGLEQLRREVEERRQQLDSTIAAKAELVDNGEDLEKIKTVQEEIKSSGVRSQDLGQKLSEITTSIGMLKEQVSSLEERKNVLLSEAAAEVSAAEERQKAERGEVNFSTGYRVRRWFTNKWEEAKSKLAERKEKSE